MSQLQLLFLQNNSLEGPFPLAWSRTDQINRLSRGGANVNASTSSSVLQSLQVLDASHNHLTGQIPASLLKSSSICILLLSDNLFTGIIPVLSPAFFEPYCVLSEVGLPPFTNERWYKTPCELVFRPMNRCWEITVQLFFVVCRNKREGHLHL